MRLYDPGIILNALMILDLGLDPGTHSTTP